MRITTGNILSLKEQKEFNRVALSVLRFIHECMQIPEGVSGDAFVVSFKKVKDSAYYVAELHGVDRNTPIFYSPPDGCNMDDVFECLYCEVLILAYVMTNGAIDEQGEEKAIERSVNDYGPVFTYTMRFVRRF